LHFRVLFTAFGVDLPRSTTAIETVAVPRKLLSIDEKFFFLHKNYLHLYLNHPEFSEKVDAQLTEKGRNDFKSMAHDYHYCLNLPDELIRNGEFEICLINRSKRYGMAEVEKIIKVIQKVRKELPLEKQRQVWYVYERIIKFIRDNLKDVSRLGGFDQQEKEFLQTLLDKHARFLKRGRDDFETTVELAKLQKMIKC